MHNISRENILLNLFNTLNIWKRLSHLPTYFILLLLLLFLPCTLITLWRDVGQLGISLWWLFGSLFRCSGTWMSKGPFGFFSARRKRLVAILQTVFSKVKHFACNFLVKPWFMTRCDGLTCLLIWWRINIGRWNGKKYLWNLSFSLLDSDLNFLQINLLYLDLIN